MTAPPLALYSVIIPARDEQDSLPSTVKDIYETFTREGVPHEIVVVDDGSNDRTWTVLNELKSTVPTLTPVQNPGRHGFGRAVILSDGDVVFQPRKVQRSGLWDAVDGRVLIYIHKEQMLEAVQKRYPARHYVMVDDKLRILGAMKKIMQQRLTTVFPRQGHYAHDPAILAAYPPADLSVGRIGDLLDIDIGEILWQH